MGMFDNVQCNYPLPWPEAQGGVFQSKHTPDQYLTDYEITEDGILVRHDCDGLFSVDHTGEIEIHDFREVDGVNYWYSVMFWFRSGEVRDAVFSKSKSNNQTTKCETW